MLATSSTEILTCVLLSHMASCDTACMVSPWPCMAALAWQRTRALGWRWELPPLEPQFVGKANTFVQFGLFGCVLLDQSTGGHLVGPGMMTAIHYVTAVGLGIHRCNPLLECNIPLSTGRGHRGSAGGTGVVSRGKHHMTAVFSVANSA